MSTGRSALCGIYPLGPLQDGVITECFQDTFLITANIIFLLVFGGLRLRQINRLPEKFLPYTPFVIFKIFIATWLGVLPLIRLIVRVAQDSSPTFALYADGLNSVGWVFCNLLIVLEFTKGLCHNWVLQVWFVLMFLLGSVRMQTLINVAPHAPSLDEFGVNFWIFVVNFAFVIVITVLALFLNYIPTKSGDLRDQWTKDPDEVTTNSESYNTFKDVDDEQEEVLPNREVSANFFSKITFSFIGELLQKGWGKPLSNKDVPDLHPSLAGAHCYDFFANIWIQELEHNSKKPSVLRLLFKAYFREFFVVPFMWKLINDCSIFVGPIILNRLISFMEDPTKTFWYGLMLGLILFVANIIQSVAENQYFYHLFRTSYRMRASLVTLIYRKAIVLKGTAFTVGEIVNVMSLDVQRLQDLLPYLHMVWSAPLQLSVAFVLLWMEIGASTIAGILVMSALIPINTFVGKKLAVLQKEMMKKKDSRIKLMNEIMQGIRVIKYFAWETNFFEKLNVIREAELQTLKSSIILRTVGIVLWTSAPLFVTLTIFSLFSVLGNVLTPSRAFTALALINIMRFPLNILPSTISSIIESQVSIGRIQKYLLSDEIDPQATIRNTVVNRNQPSVTVTNASFKWDLQHERLTLSDMDFTVNQSELVVIIGEVGSGKSSLLSGLLGEISKMSGEVRINGTVAYVPQQAWIQNATLRENIVLSSPFDQHKYEEVLRSCELLQDIAILPQGDQTEIGEKGINLSGGQKQRVSMARAVYRNADIYLLDDPLSAVDAHVGRNIFHNAILEKLGNKTRVLVTHQLQFLPSADRIIVLKDGKIVEIGSYPQLMAAGLDFASLMSTHVLNKKSEEEEAGEEVAEQKEEKKKDEKKEVAAAKEAGAAPKKGGKLMSEEDRAEGRVNWLVYHQYFVAMGSGFIGIAILLFYVLDQASNLGANIWLSDWSEKASETDTRATTMKYLGIYMLIGFVNICMVFLRSFIISLGSIQAARTLHQTAFANVLRAPMSFFDTTPLGRIINRFSKDVYVLDESLSRALSMFLSTILSCLGIIIIVSSVSPFILTAFIPLAWIYRLVQQYFIKTSVELKRLDSISRSPIFAHFGETVTGAQTIRSYGVAPQFIQQNESKLDLSQKIADATAILNRWLALRLQILGSMVVALSALYAILGRDHISAGSAGLSITYAMSVTGTLNWLTRQTSEVETYIVAVERLSNYTQMPTEAPAIIENRRPPADWPNRGSIRFENVKMRYRPGLELVLRGISFEIEGREKIGVVGRTGAGKSSLILAIFRMIEIEDGRIFIDDVDTATIGLEDLRSRISIIPQDPVLFSGTIRSNLDPFSQHSDQSLWEVLRKVHIFDAVCAMPRQLDSTVEEFGENLSVGQRQLMCLGRALLRRAKLILMDEATAAVDFETDALIQKTIRTEFADVTVITIAHRINTIIDSDRVLALDKGVLAELDRPVNLLKNKNSVFYGLVNNPSAH